MTDDQGYGDFGIMGNPLLNTPHFDQLARQSAWMTDFYVSPVCSPTRASLMTGRYNYRTRVVDTWKGRSMMAAEEYTIAEALTAAGYATGIFGKWHLGDNYPLRASDQGFQESLVIFGGGLGQASDPLEAKGDYTNPILYHNNEKVQMRGYCTDLYFEAAIDFIDDSVEQQQPFFAYIPTNAPHSPYHDVPEALYQKYKRMDLRPVMTDGKGDADTLARIFAMIENIDENIGRLMDHLERRQIVENTIVIFLNDNGPNTRRYVGPFRGMKTEIHEGAVRSPLWVRWPARIAAGQSSDRISAHYDIMPTLLEATGATVPAYVKMDGRSILPLLEGKKIAWPDRELFIQTHRGNEPQPLHHMLVRNQKWKLLRPTAFRDEIPPSDVPLELYDLENDPGETRNLVVERKDIVQQLLGRYDAWFADVSSTRPDTFAAPRMHIGSPANDRLILTGQDRRIVPEGLKWPIQIDQAGLYKFDFQWEKPEGEKRIQLTLGAQTLTVQAPAGAQTHTVENVSLPAGPLDLLLDPSSEQLPYYIYLSKQ